MKLRALAELHDAGKAWFTAAVERICALPSEDDEMVREFQISAQIQPH